MKKSIIILISILILMIFSGCIKIRNPLFEFQSEEKTNSSFNLIMRIYYSSVTEIKMYLKSPWLEHSLSDKSNDQQYVLFLTKPYSSAVLFSIENLNSQKYGYKLDFFGNIFPKEGKLATAYGEIELPNDFEDTELPVIEKVNAINGTNFNIEAYDNIGIKTVYVEIAGQKYDFFYNFNKKWLSDYISKSGDSYKITAIDYKGLTSEATGIIN